MKEKPKKQLTHWLKVIVIGIALGLALQFVRAWTEPTTAPPGGNVGAPINTGANEQTKAGDICTTAPNGTGAKKCLSVPDSLQCADFWAGFYGGGGVLYCSYFSTVLTKLVSGGYQSWCGENIDYNRPWGNNGWYVMENTSACDWPENVTYVIIRCCM